MGGYYFTILHWFCHTSTWICHRYTRVPQATYFYIVKFRFLLHPSDTQLCFPMLEPLWGRNQVSSSCSFLHQHSSPCCSPIWAGTEREVVTDPSLHQGSQLAARICVECSSDHRTHKLEKKVSNFFCKGSCSKYVQHCRLCDVCYNHSTLPSWCEKSHRKYVNEWPWLCSNKNVFTKTGWEPDMAQGCCWLTPSLKPFILWPVPLDWNPNSYPACQASMLWPCHF